MRLAAKWRKRKKHDDDDNDGLSLPTRDDFQPLDTQQQEEIVRSFEKKHAQQSLIWRSVFGAIILAYAAFLVYSIYQQVWAPWELRFHAYFMDEINHWVLISADWISVLACLLAVKGLIQSSRGYQQWMRYSCYTGLLLAVFWLYYMLRLPKFRWDIIWLPFGPLSGAAISLYVDHLMEESLDDIRKLRGCMYSFKAM